MEFKQAMYITQNGEVIDLGKYEISDTGILRNNKGKVMKTYLDNSGYESIQLRVNGRKQGFKIHRMVLSTFKPTEYQAGFESDHISPDITNNNLSNLQWLSKQANNDKREFKNPVIAISGSKMFVALNTATAIKHLQDAGATGLYSGHVAGTLNGDRAYCGTLNDEPIMWHRLNDIENALNTLSDVDFIQL